MTSTKLVFVATLMATTLAASGGALQDQAKTLTEKNSKSIIWVTAVAKAELLADGASIATQEQKVRTLGTVIDPSGLTVTALTNIDPTIAMEGQRTINGRRVTLTGKTEHSQAKLILPDGEEVPARIVLTDPDLDLAFLAPEQPGKTFEFVKLAKVSDVVAMDQVLCLARLSEHFGQIPAVTTTNVTAVSAKPRKFFILERSIMGCPVFLIDGKLLGITINYRGETDEVGNRRNQGLVLPAEDVMDVAKQALEKAKEPVTSKPVDESSNAPATLTPATRPAPAGGNTTATE